MASKRDYYGNIRAPEFPDDVAWLNTEQPLALANLRGKLVLLDFWTYGCINCIHILPDLARLESEYGDALVVIGVHSAKFANEGELENLRNIVARYEIDHPIVNDRDFRIWQAYAIRAWPTTVLIDPRGYVLAAHSGERVYETYHDLVARAIQEYEAKGLLDRAPLTFRRQQHKSPHSVLSFPGKVLADEVSNHLFIADSNHHRIVIADLQGRVQDVIGSGVRGLVDGSFEQARFAKPQGMALRGGLLYIADTENHALRVANLHERRVHTIAGDGAIGYARDMREGGPVRLNSPWALAWLKDRLYIAMAGMHQIWVLDPASGRIGPYAGSGREGLYDAPLPQAALAQPSGLATDGRLLYVVDSEASAIRVIETHPMGRVRTLIGEGLFEFGDVDGPQERARLQHPLGITYYRGTLYIADTYNHKIKVVDTENASATTLLGDGKAGYRDGRAARLFEPGGLSTAAGHLYIADTNNHVIRVADLGTQEVYTLALQDDEGLLDRRLPSDRLPLIRLPSQRIRAGEGSILVDLRLPEGHKLNALAPSHLSWQLPEGVQIYAATEIDLREQVPPLTFQANFAVGHHLLQAELTLYYCTSEESTCLIERARIEWPLHITSEAENSQIAAVITIGEAIS